MENSMGKVLLIVMVASSSVSELMYCITAIEWKLLLAKFNGIPPYIQRISSALCEGWRSFCLVTKPSVIQAVVNLFFLTTGKTSCD